MADVEFETNNPLPMRGGLTIDVYIPKGILKEPSGLTKFFWFIGGKPDCFLPLVTLAVMFLLWWYKGRDPDPGMSVAPMYEPPEGISPAEAGTLLEDSIQPRDITSTIVDLAVRGYIKIEETDDKGLLFHHKDYIFHLLKPMSQWTEKGVVPHERVMLTNIFLNDVQETRLSSLKNRFYTAVPLIRTDIMSALKQKGVYALDPESANGYSAGAAVCILIPFAVLQFLGWVNFFSSVPMVVVSVLIAAVIWWLFARVMTAKTLKGRAYLHRRPRIPGIHESCRRRAVENNAARHVRKISSLRNGARRGASLGAGLRRNRERSADVGMWARDTDTVWALIQFCFRRRCMVWRRICIRYLCRLRGRVLRDRDGAVVAASAAAEDSLAAVSAAAAAARSRRSAINSKQGQKRRTRVSDPTRAKYGAPGETRTPNPLLRRQMLYPVELRAPGDILRQITALSRVCIGCFLVARGAAGRLLGKAKGAAPERDWAPPH